MLILHRTGDIILNTASSDNTNTENKDYISLVNQEAKITVNTILHVLFNLLILISAFLNIYLAYKTLGIYCISTTLASTERTFSKVYYLVFNNKSFR